MKKLLLFLLLIGAVACSKTQNTKLPQQIESLIAQDKYPEALALLDGQEETPEILKLKEKTHLNYGLFLEYRDSDITNMRDKMNSALSQYIEVLKLNIENEKAISEIDQILGIYSSMPDRKPDEKVIEELHGLGFEY